MWLGIISKEHETIPFVFYPEPCQLYGMLVKSVFYFLPRLFKYRKRNKCFREDCKDKLVFIKCFEKIMTDGAYACTFIAPATPFVLSIARWLLTTVAFVICQGKRERRETKTALVGC